MKRKNANAVKIVGETTQESHSLAISFLPEIVYVPTTPGKQGGLFDLDGAPIPAAVYHRGDQVTFSSIDESIDISALPTIKNGSTHFFIGDINPHYGHFLLESTVRLWPLLHWPTGFSGKFLYLGPPAVVEKKAFIRQVFETHALDSKDFVAYPAPCKIKNVFIPAPSFEIRLRAHRLFSDTLRHSGERLAGDLEKINNTNLTPLYLSRAKLAVGISCIINETAIEDALRQAGVDILYPETLSLADQIRELASRKYLISQVGSALHTLLFCPGGKTIAAVSLIGELISSNYILIDLLCGNDSHYLASTDLLIGKADSTITEGRNFSRKYYAHRPEFVAEQLLAALQEPLSTDLPDAAAKS